MQCALPNTHNTAKNRSCICRGDKTFFLLPVFVNRSKNSRKVREAKKDNDQEDYQKLCNRLGQSIEQRMKTKNTNREKKTQRPILDLFT